MRFDHWNNPEIELYEIKEKKSNVLITFRLFGNKEKYHFILSGNGINGFDIYCLGNFNKHTSYITLFTYQFIQDSLKDFLYCVYPGLTIRDTFSNEVSINRSFDMRLNRDRSNIINYANHFSPLVLTAILMNSFAFLILFSFFDGFFDFGIPFIIGLTSYFFVKTDYFKRLYKECVLYRKYSNNFKKASV